MAMILAAACLLLAGSSAQGKYIATQRYEQWYGEGMTKDSVFQTNLVFTSDPRSSLAGAFPPALAPTVLVDNILFETAERPAETRLFHGTFRVPACRAGVYRVRVTSQDSHDMFVDQQHVIKTNGVKTGGVVVNEVALHFKPNTDHSMELWWGISGGKSSVKMEWCYSGTATLLAKQAGLMSEIQGDGDSGAVRLEDIELPSSVEDRGCKWSTDLSRVMVPHEGNSIQRCDYTGYHADDMTFPKKNSAASTKIIPTGCASELGGVIAMEASGVSSTFVYTVPLKPRVSGLHTVFLGCGEHDGIFSVFIDPTKTGAADAEMDVEVPEISIRAYPDPSPPAPIPDPTPKPGPEPGPKPGPKPGPSEGKMKWLQSSAYLRQGQLYAVRIVYGNKVKPGSLRVLWLDTLSSEPETSFVPILP